MPIKKTLHSLLITGNALAAAPVLERILRVTLASYEHHFAICALADMGQVTDWIDLVFVDDTAGTLEAADVAVITGAFKKTTCVVLGDFTGEQRAELIRNGVDEVMSMGELESPLGRHLLEKLLAFKQLAEAQQRAVRSEERFKGVIEHAHEIMLLVDADGTVVYTSPAFARQSGYEEWEVLGESLFHFIHPDDMPSAQAGFAAVCGASPNTPHGLEYRLSSKNGGWRQCEVVATNLLGADTVHAVVMNLRDVTAQRQAEEQLENYREHLETLVEKRTRELVEVQARANTVIDASPDALLAMDAQGTILFISEHYRQSYPKSAAVLVPGRNVADAFRSVAVEIGLQENDSRFLDVLNWWKAPRGTVEFVMNNGTILRLRAKQMQDGRGTVVATTNITDLKRQQAMLAEQAAELAAALETERDIVEQQKTFVSMVSHEFRTPLTIIDGNAQIIQNRAESIDPAALVKRGATIRGAVDRLVRLIEAILSSHMMDSGRLRADPMPCDVGAVIAAAVRDQQEIASGHTLATQIDGLPPQMMLDEKIIRQMLANLLSNAVKYSPGKDRVDVRAFRQGRDVVISVQDYGVGIPEKELPKIASKYFRASTSSGIPGTGLGLSLVRRFVELHGGQFDIASVEGEGTIVTVRLPVEAVGSAS